ncbi:MAG: hypothetical protein WCP31_12865 [Chloroflexales bacterium]
MMRPAHGLLLFPMVVYVLLAVVWYAQRINPITGDEPHYLLTADSLWRDGDVQVVNNHQLDTPVLRELPPGAVFTTTHTQNGYSLHGLGLPLLLVPAYAVAGVLGAKVWLALLNGLIPLVFYRLARPLGDARWALAVAVMLGLGQPCITASSQIYPDLLAGLLILTLVTDWRELEAAQPRAGLVLRSGLLLALLPWLHLKLALPAIILGGFMAGRYWRMGGQGRTLAWRLSLLLAISLSSLGAYQAFAFGSVLGPYQAGDATTDGQRIAMILLGLHLDRLQGLFFQGPIYLLGVFGLASFFTKDWPLARLTGLLYLAVMLPNAMHTNWYGGMSFAGRFHWTGALLWSLPLLAALRQLRAGGHTKVAVGLLVGAGLLQLIVLAKLLIPNGNLYNLPLDEVSAWTVSNPYADFLALEPWQRALFLPSFHTVNTYLSAPVNWVACGVLVVLLVAGWVGVRKDCRL